MLRIRPGKAADQRASLDRLTDDPAGLSETLALLRVLDSGTKLFSGIASAGIPGGACESTPYQAPGSRQFHPLYGAADGDTLCCGDFPHCRVHELA
jgi:hypothetical protein